MIQVILSRRLFREVMVVCETVASGLAKTILQRHSERGKKTMQTEEEVGRQHQGMDRPGVCQVPEGGGEQGKMEESGCEIIYGAPMTLMVKG